MTFGDNTLSFVFDELPVPAAKHASGGSSCNNSTHPSSAPEGPGRAAYMPAAGGKRRNGFYQGKGGYETTRSKLGQLVSGSAGNCHSSVDPQRPRGSAAVAREPDAATDTAAAGSQQNLVDTSGIDVAKSAQTHAIPLRYNAFRHSWSSKWNGDVTWPTSTSAACWWCCHGFDTVPVPLPTKYCPKLDAFNVTGNFCSWSCARSYANTTRHALQSSELLSLLRRKLCGRVVTTKLAPPRHELHLFGGSMTIDEFRAACEYPNRQIMAVHIQQQPFGVRTKPSSSQGHVDEGIRLSGGHTPGATYDSRHGADNAFSALSGAVTPAEKRAAATKELTFNNIANKKNEPLKLKRNKPVAKNKTVLEKVLGLTFTPMPQQ